MVNTVLNRIVHNAYKITSTMDMTGQGHMFPVNNDRRTMLDTLCIRYGKAIPSKKQDSKRNWSAPWKISLPIEDLCYRLKMCFVVVVVSEPPCTRQHKYGIPRPTRPFQERGLIVIVCLEWKAMASDRWINLKDHFTKAYEAFLVTSK